MEQAWMIEATRKQCNIFNIPFPAWWVGSDPHIKDIYSNDPNEGIRFSRREDADKVIKGWGILLKIHGVFLRSINGDN